MRVLLLLALALLQAGCATVGSLPQRPAMQDITQFAFVGRLALQQGEVRQRVNIDWRHAAQRDEILLTTPLGQGVAAILRDSSGARVTFADQRSYSASDWNALAQQLFGFALPLGASARWLLGDSGGLEGWRMTVVARESTAVGALPTVIELERDDIFVRLRIDEWIEAR